MEKNEDIARTEKELSRLRTLVLLLAQRYVATRQGEQLNSIDVTIGELIDVVSDDEAGYYERTLDLPQISNGTHHFAEDLEYAELFTLLSEEQQQEILANKDESIGDQIIRMKSMLGMWGEETTEDLPLPRRELTISKIAFSGIDVSFGQEHEKRPELRDLPARFQKLTENYRHRHMTSEVLDALAQDVLSILRWVFEDDLEVSSDDFWVVEVDVTPIDRKKGDVDIRLIPRVVNDSDGAFEILARIEEGESEPTSFQVRAELPHAKDPLVVEAPTEIEAIVGLAKLLIVRQRN